ncbi:hypothetical protein DSO57_1012807 [Entomophthora muscae]|uniref:Uncharacterized protein n=1 Tax=Entomophthora muscae TaxID=34485 RepID=A0ACC2URR3_9FUNG|nr:hypothetical protein DSO57_1012807 [Entomophthora muscae]
MSEVWLNVFHGELCDINEQPQCSYDTQLGEDGCDGEQENSMTWDTFGKPIHIDPVLSLFRVLKPRITGFVVSKEIELDVLLQGYEWMSLMVYAEADREVYEAAILLLCSMTVVEEETGKSIEEMGVLEKMDANGYTVEYLLGIIGRVLIPSLVERLKQLMVACIQEQERHKFPDPQTKVSMYLNMKTSYDKYLRFRNLDGFFEGGLLLCLASAGISGEGLTVGAMGDVIESAIHSHDSHGIIRHFTEEDIANMHRYASGGMCATLERSFLHNAQVSRQVREADIPGELKHAILNYSSCYHLFSYSNTRYGYGGPYAEAVAFNLNEKKVINPFN